MRDMNQPDHIVVVGSVNVDQIVRVDRLPGPGETVAGDDFVTAGGGKGANQAVAARRLGADVSFVARVGTDGSGTFARSALESEGIAARWIGVDPDYPTGVALIIVDRDGQNMIAVASGANLRVSPNDVRAAEEAFAAANVVITQLEIPLETVVTTLEMGRTRGLTTVLNPAPARVVPDDILGLADWLTPNEFEASALSGVEVRDLPSARQAAKALLRRGARRVVLTMGDRGALYVSSTGDHLDVPSFSVSAVDTTAAGDAFTAGLAVAIGRGLSTASALQYASACGALATTRSGAQPSLPREDSVQALLARQNDRSPELT